MDRGESTDPPVWRAPDQTDGAPGGSAGVRDGRDLGFRRRWRQQVRQAGCQWATRPPTHGWTGHRCRPGPANNEDYALADRVVGPDGAYALWIVADGVGGGPDGERASRLAVETVVEFLTPGSWTDPRAALTQAFALANDRVHSLSAINDSSSASVMATTLVAALVSEVGRAAYVANVGDSRAYLIDSAHITRVTQDHSFIAEQVAAGQLTEAEAQLAGGHNILTRGIGTDATVVVDVFGPRRLGAGERLLLCSDGLHGMVEDAEIARIVRASSVSEAPSALVAAANVAGGRDNVTALVGGAALATGTTRAAPGPRLLVAGGLVAAFLVGIVALLSLGGGSGKTPGGTIVVPSRESAPSATLRTSAAPSRSSVASASPSTPRPTPRPTPSPSPRPSP